MKITYTRLQNKGACDAALTSFKVIFGNSVELTIANVKKYTRLATKRYKCNFLGCDCGYNRAVADIQWFCENIIRAERPHTIREAYSLLRKAGIPEE